MDEQNNGIIPLLIDFVSSPFVSKKKKKNVDAISDLARYKKKGWGPLIHAVVARVCT